MSGAKSGGAPEYTSRTFIEMDGERQNEAGIVKEDPTALSDGQKRCPFLFEEANHAVKLRA